MKNRLWIIGIVLAVGLTSGGSEGAVNSSGHVAAIEAGEKSAHGSSDGISAKVNISFATSITTDGTNLYVVDTNDHVIQKIVISTGEVSTFAGLSGVSGESDGYGSGALFNNPQGITTDRTNLYIADTGNCTIRKIALATGEVSTLAGTAGKCNSVDGTGAAAQFGAPHGITTDKTYLYVADIKNNAVRKVSISTGAVTTLRDFTKTSASSDASSKVTGLNLATEITTDGTNLYLADNGGQTIRQMALETGKVTTLAGTVGAIGSTDGSGSVAQFGAINGITISGSSLYVADTYNGTIRKIIISNGQVSTLAGTAGTFGFDDGVRTEARFDLVSGITTDGANLYCMNNGNNSIRKIAIATGKVTTL